MRAEWLEMPLFPRLLETRRLPNRLRSFHLSPSLAEDNPRTNKLSVPLRGSTLIKIVVLASLFFVISILCAFLGVDMEDLNFKTTLDEVAIASPGVCFVLSLQAYLYTPILDCVDWREHRC